MSSSTNEEKPLPHDTGLHSLSPDPEVAHDGELRRDMSSWHLVFLAVGGTIGTGLFIGIGGALQAAGPVGVLIAFIFIGSVVYSIMTSLGEMATYIPVAGSFTVYTSRFVDHSLGFAMGWMYWLSWAITYALQLTAAGQIIQYWNKNLSIGIWVVVFWVVFTAANFMPIRLFAETEMYFASIKVVTILGFIIFGICMNAGAGQEGYIGFKYWKDPGPFAYDSQTYSPAIGKFVGFWSVLITAAFTYQGAELVGIGVGETGDPRKNVPRAIRGTFYGLLFFLSFTVLFVGLNVPSNDPNLGSKTQDASASPLVIATLRAGIRVLPHIINAVLLTAVLSAANSIVYSSSRILVALAEEGCAPKFVTRTTRWGIPYIAVMMSAVIGLLGLVNLGSTGQQVFQWFVYIIGVAGLIGWGCISLTHIRFMKALKMQGFDRKKEMPYLAPFQPWLAYYGLFWVIIICFTQGFSAFTPQFNIVSFFASYVSLIMFMVLLLVHKVIGRMTGRWRTGLVPLKNMDLLSERSEVVSR